MSSDNKTPIQIANSSGFPLQIATSSVVNKSRNWRVMFEEHLCRLNDKTYFIDVIAESGDVVMVIECKRVRDTKWVFLIPETSPSLQTHATVLIPHYIDQKPVGQEWINLAVEPSSYLSFYCAIQGQENGRNQLIERISSELIDSIEALAEQEIQLHSLKSKGSFWRTYIPVIVTTAKLFVALFDPKTISLNEGSLPDMTASKDVPYVRFRKSLATHVEYTSASSVEDIHNMSERTIFIVNAEKLSEFLDKFQRIR